MKKSMLVLLLITVLCFTACTAKEPPATGTNGNPSGSATVPGTGSTTAPTTTPGVTELDIWEGVEGDSRQFAINAGGMDAYLCVNRDGSAQFDRVYMNYTHLSDANDETLKKLDAEIAAFMTYYGTYEVQEDRVVFDLELLPYLRYSLRGVDAEAAKTAFIQTGAAEYKDPAAFDKGIVIGQAQEGRQEYVLAFTEGTYTLISSTTVTDEGTTEIRFAEDGSYVANVYTTQGVLVRVDEYSAEGDMVKRTCYNSDGEFLYVEVNEQGDHYHTTTRTDEAGNVIYLEEIRLEEKDGMTVNIHKITENGIVTNLWHSEHGNEVSREYHKEVQSDGSVHVSISVTDYRQNNAYHIQEYVYSETIRDGVRVEYGCSVRYGGVKVGDVYNVNIFYMKDLETYELYEEFYQGEQIRTNIAAADYVPADWEKPIWNPGE